MSSSRVSKSIQYSTNLRFPMMKTSAAKGDRYSLSDTRAENRVCNLITTLLTKNRRALELCSMLDMLRWTDTVVSGTPFYVVFGVKPLDLVHDTFSTSLADNNAPTRLIIHLLTSDQIGPVRGLMSSVATGGRCPPVYQMSEVSLTEAVTCNPLLTQSPFFLNLLSTSRHRPHHTGQPPTCYPPTSLSLTFSNYPNFSYNLMTYSIYTNYRYCRLKNEEIML